MQSVTRVEIDRHRASAAGWVVAMIDAGSAKRLEAVWRHPAAGHIAVSVLFKPTDDDTRSDGSEGSAVMDTAITIHYVTDAATAIEAIESLWRTVQLPGRRDHQCAASAVPTRRLSPTRERGKRR